MGECPPPSGFLKKIFMNTFTLDTRIPKNEFRQTIETDNLNRLCSMPWVNSSLDFCLVL